MCHAQERILSRGLGPFGSLNLALVGSLYSVTGAAGETNSGVWVKSPAMKSSTMKGAKALESESLVETVPNREQPSLVSNGALLVSALRNRTTCGEYASAEALDIECGLEAGPPSNVTAGMKSSLIREGVLLPPVVWRCLIGNEVIQTQETGRVVQVEASPSLTGSERAKSLQGSGEIVPCSGGAEQLKRTTNGLTGNTQHQERPGLREQ
jgi:hypothetical protein